MRESFSGCGKRDKWSILPERDLHYIENVPWSTDEFNFLEENYRKKGLNWCKEQLGYPRSMVKRVAQILSLEKQE